jgi:hypothetical protein
MKAIIFSLVSAILLSVVGCSNVAPVSVSTDELSTAVITVDMSSVLAKKAYSSTQKKLVVATTPARPSGQLDTFDIAGGSKSFSLSGFTRDANYLIEFFTIGDSFPSMITYADTSIRIPDSSSFSLAIKLVTMVKDIKGDVVISGTPAASIANRICVIWKSTNLGGGAPYIDSLDTAFTPGTLSSFHVSSVLPIRPQNINGLTTYEVTVYVYCTDGGFYKGVSNIDLSMSSDQPLNVSLTKYGGISSLAKITVTLVPITKLVFSTSFAD